jgi:tripartite-type tricarboxylate transporter receptor subunit TctC
MAPGATPREIVTRLNAETVKAVHSPAVRERFAALGTEPVGNSSEECAAFVRSEIQKWEKVVKASGAKAD